MMTTIETYVRAGRSEVRKWAADPVTRVAVQAGLCFISGLLLSGVGLARQCQPLSMGLVLAMAGWPAAVTAAGGVAGYLLF